MLLTVALIAAPVPFATLVSADAGRVAARVFAAEAYASLLLSVLWLLLERRRAGAVLSRNLVLALGALFCTVAGYFALQPMMAAARGGQAALSFAQLHAVSLAFYAIKTVLVLALAWRVTAWSRPSSSSSSAASSRA